MRLKSIEEIDKNFAAEQVSYEGMTTFHLPCKPFQIRGMYRTAPGEYWRLPMEVAQQCNEALQEMQHCPSGGRIRFRTDSRRIVIKCSIPDMKPMHHMAFTGSHCFALYADGAYVNTFRPNVSGSTEFSHRADLYASDQYESLLRLPGGKMQQIEIYFPLYSRVKDVWLALEDGAAVEEPAPYAHETPFVFYGTSATQGGCVCQPGNNYPAFLSRWLDSDFINLGFSDGGRGDPAMAEYIATLPMSALVLDFDGNTRSVENAWKVYEPFFKIVRAARRSLPIIFATMLGTLRDGQTAGMHEVVRTAYEHAVAAGDKLVWYINEEELIAPYGGTEVCTVDRLHINDLGSWAVAKGMEPLLRRVIEGQA